MEKFCRALHPDLELSPTCLSWFRQATMHCTTLINRSREPGMRIWATVKNFIFPERQTGLVNQNIPISIHPNRLSIQDCQSLFLDIVHDYILRAPRYSTEAATNALLWQILYSLMGVMVLGSLLVSTIFAYRKFGRSLERMDPLQAVFAPEKRARAYVNHNVRVVKYETQRLHVRHLVQPEELFPPDGSTTLVMKMSSKLNFIDGLVSSTATCTGRLYRMYEMMGKKKPEYKVETLPKVMRFINSYSRKLRVLLIFDEDPVYEELLRQRKSKSPPKLSPPKCASPVLRSGSMLSTRSSSSPRSSSQPAKQKLLSPRPPTQASSPTPSPVFRSGSMLSTRSSSSPRSSSQPAKQKLLSPRPPTQIPQNFARRNSSANLKRPAKKEASGGDN